MTDQKWIALLGFLVTACGILATLPALAAYKDYFSVASLLIGAFMAAWFGVKPVYQARQASKQLKTGK